METQTHASEMPFTGVPKGRFAPSPSGRMHLGNLFTALVSWLSVKSRGGKWVLRIEDLDRQRSREEYAMQIEDDLLWLGLEWDEGGLKNIGDAGPYCQSMRDEIYADALRSIGDRGLLSPCRCRRSDILATQAPHQSDGRVVYAGTCRPSERPPFLKTDVDNLVAALRLYVPDENICFTDLVFGKQSINLARHCGDFVMRRADGAWAYQLAVVVDDALMGVTEVVRGCDLLISTAQQIYLYSLLGYDTPEFMHLPLICNHLGQRLSKRDAMMDVGTLRKNFTAREVLGRLAYMARLIPEPVPIGLGDLIPEFSVERIPAVGCVIGEGV